MEIELITEYRSLIKDIDKKMEILCKERLALMKEIGTVCCYSAGLDKYQIGRLFSSDMVDVDLFIKLKKIETLTEMDKELSDYNKKRDDLIVSFINRM